MGMAGTAFSRLNTAFKVIAKRPGAIAEKAPMNPGHPMVVNRPAGAPVTGQVAFEFDDAVKPDYRSSSRAAASSNPGSCGDRRSLALPLHHRPETVVVTQITVS